MAFCTFRTARQPDMLFGCMLVFENEITEWSRPDLYQVKEIKAEPLPVEMLLERVAETLPDSVSVAGVSIPSEKGRTWQVNLSKPRPCISFISIIRVK